jgi:hypothetical protein
MSTRDVACAIQVSGRSGSAFSHERLPPPVQLGDPSIRIQAWRSIPGFDLSILPDADTDRPGCATDPETLTLPSALHHPRGSGQGRHVQSLERAEDARSAHFVTRAARSLERGGPSVITGGREQRASPSPFACLARPPNVGRRRQSPQGTAPPSAVRPDASAGSRPMSAQSSPRPSR